MDGCIFSCISALDSVQGTFYFFDWNKHRAQALKGLAINPRAWCVEPLESVLDDTPQKNPHGYGDGGSSRPLSKKRDQRGDQLSEDNYEDFQDNEGAPQDPITPTKSRKRIRHSPPSRPSSSVEEEYIPQSGSSPRSSSPSESSVGDPLPASGSSSGSDSELDHVMSSRPQARAIPRTPSRRDRSKSTMTPRRKAAPTPHSKAALRARLEMKRRRISQQVASQTTFTDAMDIGHLPKDARLRAMHALHVGSKPEALPCREDEYADVLSKVLELVDEGAGGCVCTFACYMDPTSR